LAKGVSIFGVVTFLEAARIQLACQNSYYPMDGKSTATGHVTNVTYKTVTIQYME